jgi:thioredoxin 1
MAAKDITDANFSQETGTGVTLTDFWAAWCGPCLMQSPVVDQLAGQRSDVSFLKMDVDANPETAQEMGIMAIPTLIIKKDGEIVEHLTGYTPADQLNNILNQYTK